MKKKKREKETRGRLLCWKKILCLENDFCTFEKPFGTLKVDVDPINV
jgi:hypothetical protein